MTLWQQQKRNLNHPLTPLPPTHPKTSLSLSFHFSIFPLNQWIDKLVVPQKTRVILKSPTDSLKTFKYLYFKSDLQCNSFFLRESESVMWIAVLLYPINTILPDIIRPHYKAYSLYIPYLDSSLQGPFYPYTIIIIILSSLSLFPTTWPPVMARSLFYHFHNNNDIRNKFCSFLGHQQFLSMCLCNTNLIIIPSFSQNELPDPIIQKVSNTNKYCWMASSLSKIQIDR